MLVGWLQLGPLGSFHSKGIMLDSYIIEELKRRERERTQRERQRPILEIPKPEEEDDRRSDREDIPGQAVAQIDL